ncbi:MAG: hypothetical protein QM537_00985 [Candidatus Symbiobacter sp.]|nr:hypothetical protein [Candidatus Symbiobacter sp.]
MVIDSKRLEDVGKLAESALGGAAGEALAQAQSLAQSLRSEAQAIMKGGFDRLTNDMQLARREELDELYAVVVAGREVQNQILQRLDALEARVQRLEATKS